MRRSMKKKGEEGGRRKEKNREGEEKGSEKEGMGEVWSQIGRETYGRIK